MRALIVVLALVVSLLLSECILQILDARSERMARERQAELENGDLPLLKTVFELVQPHQRGIDAGVLYETNSFGIRGPERTMEKPAGVFRTVVIGDSFTMGSGVLQEDAYPAILERARPLIDGRAHEVINLGISGLNIETGIERYQRLGTPFAPDLAIYGFTLNDLESDQYLTVTECNARREAHRASWSHVWRRAREHWVWLSDAIWRPADSYAFELDLNYFSNPPLWTWFDEQLEGLAEIGRKRGICTLLLIHTQLETLNRFHPYTRQYEAVARAATEHGLFVAESFSHFRNRRAASLSISVADSHPNANGHGILVEAILDGLDALPKHCFARARQ